MVSNNILYVTDSFLMAMDKARTVLICNIADVEKEIAEEEYKGNALKIVSTALEEQRQALAIINNLLVRFSHPDTYEETLK